jgi:hypothetical protein
MNWWLPSWSAFGCILSFGAGWKAHRLYEPWAYKRRLKAKIKAMRSNLNYGAFGKVQEFADKRYRDPKKDF